MTAHVMSDYGNIVTFRQQQIQSTKAHIKSLERLLTTRTNRDLSVEVLNMMLSDANKRLKYLQSKVPRRGRHMRNDQGFRV